MSRQDLLNALHALHHSRDGNVSKQASVWLEQWQYTVEAWSISDGLLHEAESTLEIQHFCAQTLRTKVQRNFEELPAGAAESLRSSLVELLLRYGNAGIVRTQLCLAIAALVAHLPSEGWGPGGSVQWLVQRLGMEPGPSALPCLLDLLTILPQEAGSYRPAVRPERRRQMVDEMVAATPTALHVLTTILQQHSGPNVGLHVLEAFSEWLKLGSSRSLDGAALAEHPLVTAALEGLGRPAEFDGAVDAIIELVYLSSSGGQPEDRMLPLVARLVPAVMRLLPRFVKSAEQARAAAAGHHTGDDEEEEDEETAKGMARLFAEVGEAYTALIATGQEALQPLEALLAVASHPDNDLAAMSFNSWHRLSRHLTSGFGPTSANGSGSADTQGSEDAQMRSAVFKPAFERLVALIRGRVRYPEDWDSWEEDDRDDFKHARQDVAETLVDAAAVLGGERTLQLLTEPLAAMSAQVASGAAFDWRTAEASLYCVRAVHSKAPEAGNPLLLQLFGSLPQLPAAPAQLQYTAALALAAYSDWFAKTLQAGASAAPAGGLMPKLLEMLTTGLGNIEVASASALALKQLCDACGALLAPYLDALMSLYQRIQSAGEASTSAAPNQTTQNHAVQEADVQQIVEALTLVVSALPPEQRKAGLAALMSPLVLALQQLLQQQQRRPSSAAPMNGGTLSATNGLSQQQRQQQQQQQQNHPQMDLALPLIDRMTIIFRHVNDPVSVAEALQQVWPLLQGVIDSFHGNTHAIERLSRCPRYALRTAGKAAASLLPTLADTLPHWFETTHHSSFLYVASELIKVFGGDPDKHQQLGALFQRLMGGCCGRLRALADFNERPDMADDAFLLAGRGLSYCPSLVLTPAVLPPLLDCAMAGLFVQHRDACCSILTFLSRLFEPQLLLCCGPAAATQITAAVVPRAPKMVRLLMAGAVGALPAPRCRDITNVLIAMLQATHNQGLQWLTSTVDLIPDEAATAADRKHLLDAAAALTGQNRNPAGVRGLHDAMEEMSELVRRNRRSLDAAQTSLLAGLQL